MRAVLFAFIFAIPFAAQAGEAVTYVVDGEALEGYRSVAQGGSKALVLIIQDWDGLTQYEMKRADMLANKGYDAFAIDLFGSDRYQQRADEQSWKAFSDFLATNLLD